MKRSWITCVSALLCIGILVFGNCHYHGKVEATRVKAYEQYTEDQANINLAEAELEREKLFIDAP